MFFSYWMIFALYLTNGTSHANLKRKTAKYNPYFSSHTYLHMHTYGFYGTLQNTHYEFPVDFCLFICAVLINGENKGFIKCFSMDCFTTAAAPQYGFHCLAFFFCFFIIVQNNFQPYICYIFVICSYFPSRS